MNAILPINPELCVMQCTAAYPAEAEDLNIRVIATLRERFPEIVIGFSDHQNGYTMSLLGYMLGARVIEKHFTLNHAWKGTDHAFSLIPDGMRRLVRDLRRAPAALGDGVKRPLPSEEPAIRKMGKKLVAGRALPAGHLLAAGRPRGEVARRRRSSPVRARSSARQTTAALTRPGGERHLRGSRAGRGARRGARRRALTLDELLAGLRLAVFDFDGVFTDNRVWVNERGEEAVVCSRADGYGLRRLEEVGVEPLILSSEVVPIGSRTGGKARGRLHPGGRRQAWRPPRRGGAARCGTRARRPSSETTSMTQRASRRWACRSCPADAWPEAVRLSHWVLERRGGEGCVREFCDAVWTARR